MSFRSRGHASTQVAALLMACLVASPMTAQTSPGAATCVRVAFGDWSPPLDWGGAGHADSMARVSERIRSLRDSVFSGSATAQGRDEMHWQESNGVHQLLLFPRFWPAGVLVTFDRAPRERAPTDAPDTLVGGARALVADAGQRSPQAPARVLRFACPG